MPSFTRLPMWLITLITIGTLMERHTGGLASPTCPT